MADHGFNTSDLLDDKGVKLNILLALVILLSSTQKVIELKPNSFLCVHVERTIEWVKNYLILESGPNSIHNIANQIFFVSAMLTKFDPTLLE